MEFQLSEDQLALQDSVRRFASENLISIAERIEKTGAPPDVELLRTYAELGFLGVNLPEKYGGLGLSGLDAMILLEEFGRISTAVAFPIFESCVGPVCAIERFGSDSLKERLVPKVCRGEIQIAVSMSEPQAGTALTDLATTAEVRGGSIVLNGTKRWCSGGGHAEGYVVYCRMSDEPGARGIGAVYIDRDAPGVSFGAQEALMGFRGVPSSDIYFDNATVPRDQLIVPAGGFGKLMQAFDLERCGNATMALAQASGALDDVLQYVQERKQFGKPLVDFQAVQMKLADMRMSVDAARLLIYRAVSNAGKGLPSVAESSIAKCYANEISRSVTGDAVQLMGAYGYSKEYPAERRLRDAWGWGIAGGAIDIQKVNIAGALVGRRFDQRK